MPADDESTVAERPSRVNPGGEATRADAPILDVDAIRAAASGFDEPADEATRAESPLFEAPDQSPLGSGHETPPTENVPTDATVQLPGTPLPSAPMLPPRLTPARPISAVTARAPTPRPFPAQSVDEHPSSTKGAKTGSMVLLTTAVDALRSRSRPQGGPGRFTGHVVGSWELGNVLGRGAMGEVYEALHVKTGANAAVKMLRRELLSDGHHVERFFREVRIAAKIESPNVVKVLEASSPTDPIPYLAMELLRGQTLGEILRTGPMTGTKLAAMVAQIGGVLELARSSGIVHRDLKPHNLFLTEAGVWKVLDFGVAILADNSGTLTQGAVIGTPAYMAPEQAKGQPVDHRADVYALGAVIYRCITGRVPFVAKDTPALLYAVVHIMPLRPTALGTLAPELEAFLTIALAKDRDMRFQSTGQLAEAFVLADRGMFPPALVTRARGLVLAHPWTEPELAAEKKDKKKARRESQRAIQ